MRKHLISGWCRHISTEGCKHARTQCLNQQKPLLSFKKHKNTEVQNSENTAATKNKEHSLRCMRAWKRLFWVLKTQRNMWYGRRIFHIISLQLSLTFSRSKCNEKGCDLAKIQYQVAHNCWIISSLRSGWEALVRVPEGWKWGCLQFFFFTILIYSPCFQTLTKM